MNEQKNDQKKILSQNFFLLSLLPAVLYWYLDEHYPVRVALMGGLLLALVEIAAEKWISGHLHALSKFNFFLILILGIISLIGDKGVWFKLQPLFTGFAMGGYMLYKERQGKPLLWEMMEQMNRPLPPRDLWAPLERHLAWFFILYGIFMGVLAVGFSTRYWIFFKTIGLYIVFFLFIIIESLLMRWKIRRKMWESKPQS